MGIEDKNTFPVAHNIPQSEDMRERDARRAAGNVTNEEIKALWENPSEPFFSHELITHTKDGKEVRTKFNLCALTDKFTLELLRETQSAWKEKDFEAYAWTLGALFPEYRAAETPPPISLEYYIVTDENNHPYGMAGIYSEDYKGTRGFMNYNMLDPAKHNLVSSGAWGAVSAKKEYRKTGIGSRFLFPWIEKMARARGARIMSIYCDDAPNEEVARSLYKKGGYEQSFDVKNFYGPERDLYTYYCDISKEGIPGIRLPEEDINRENIDEVLRVAKKIYSKERLEELKVSLEMIIRQGEKKEPLPENLALLKPESIVIRDKEGKIESFAVFSNMLYENTVEVFWAGSRVGDQVAKKNLMNAIKKYTEEQEREVILFGREGEDRELASFGFNSAKNGVPGAFEKRTTTKMLFYTRRLDV